MQHTAAAIEISPFSYVRWIDFGLMWSSAPNPSTAKHIAEMIVDKHPAEAFLGKIGRQPLALKPANEHCRRFRLDCPTLLRETAISLNQPVPNR